MAARKVAFNQVDFPVPRGPNRKKRQFQISRDTGGMVMELRP
jgi:hypothetical protein